MQESSHFVNILLFIAGAVVFSGITLLISRLLRPQRSNPEKLSTYESGEEPMGSAWALFNPRYYVIALIFVLFEVEIIFLFPWAVVFSDNTLLEVTQGKWGWFTLTEMIVFVFILSIGLIYVWRKGFLDWDKPQTKIPEFHSPVPEDLYKRINKKYSKSDKK